MSDVSAQPQDTATLHNQVQPIVQQQADDSMPSDATVVSDAAATSSVTTTSDTTASDATIATSVMQSAQAYDPLNPSHPVGKSGIGAKETAAKGLDALVAEVPGAQVVETEKSAEVPPEVESWIEKVQHHEIQAPHEVVVADKTTQQLTGNYASDPVIVLPVTQQGMQTGITKSVTESARWLVEWCTRIIKKFHGMVVYRDVPQKERGT